MLNEIKNTNMTLAEMTSRIADRSKELLSIPQVFAEYQSKESEAIAKDWIMSQALITLMYSHEERMEMLKKKAA